MSSIPSAVQQICLKNKRQQQLIRSASIDRIMQFNSYLCSQNFYLLPAIISWMKSSQTILQSQLDKYITLLKSIIVGLVLSLHYKILSNAYKHLYPILVYSYKTISARLITLCIYLAIPVILTQLTACLYVIFNFYLSIGVVFLITCIHLISYVKLSMCLHYLKTENNKNKIRY
ncbi:hypothetical protein RN001_010906 [Aquatica leii]|uniref:Transmembrane protein n=1 Tax=Aquatica leii TaxID=1421715 RepID=A0AAN7SQJ7_9COLE|nr:hypothetical protein RN001_010906 [Aquatica leii]